MVAGGVTRIHPGFSVLMVISLGPMGKQLLKTPPAMGLLIVLQTGHPSELPLNQNEGFIVQEKTGHSGFHTPFAI